MDRDTDVRVWELCRRVASERDAEKLVALVREVNRLVAEKISRDQGRAK
jgi:hypothetical protein